MNNSMCQFVTSDTLRCALIACAVALTVSTLTAQEPAVVVELKTTEIFLGESAKYELLLNHFDGNATPEFAASDDYTISSIGRTMRNVSSMITRGFRTQRIEERGPQITYEVTPRRAGSITIDGPTAVQNGQTFRGESVVLRVLDVPEQDYVRLSVTADREFTYPTQSFQVRLLISVKGLPDPIQNRDPLTVQQLLALQIPWAGDDQLASGIEQRQPFDRWLGKFVARDGRGFSINGYRQRGNLLSDLLGRDLGRTREDRLAFRPQPSRVMENDLRGRKVEYWQYLIERSFVAKAAGRYAFGPVTLKGIFGKRYVEGELEGETVYAIANPLTVIVRDPPREDQPAEFTGAIGRFDCGASITPTVAKVGDPLTLTLWLRGSGTLDQAVAPSLAENPEIAKSFKVYDATEETEQDVRRFTYSLRPKVAGITEFPRVAMAYFDVDAGQYVTLNTNPVPIEVAAADQLERNQISIASPTTVTGADIEVSPDGIFANVTDLRSVRDDRVRPDRWFLGLGSMASLFLILVVGKRQVELRAGDVGTQRKRRAASRARQRLAELRGEGSALSANSVADKISDALVGMVADVGDIDEHGLTSADAVKCLRGLQAESKLLARFETVLAECDAIRYGSASGAIDQLVTSAGGLIDDLSTILRKTKQLP